MVSIVGEQHGQANTVKLGINYIMVSSIELMSQVCSLAEKSGVDVNVFHGLFQMIYAHPVFQMYATKIKNRDFDDAGFSLAGGLKDVLLMLEASNRVYAPLNYGNIIKDKLLFAMSNGLADKDWSAIYEVSRKSAGI